MLPPPVVVEVVLMLPGAHERRTAPSGKKRHERSAGPRTTVA
jgi:hypothetical protein